MKAAIIIGHTSQSKGACSPFGIPCEWDFNKKVSEYLSDIADIYFHNSYSGGYTTMVKETAKEVNKKDYEVVFALHYNAATPSAKGCESLYYSSSRKGLLYAEIACDVICSNFDVINRGVKPLSNSSDRGFGEVYYTKAPTIIVEPFFGSNESDALKFKGKEKEYADSIREMICRIINL